MKIDSTFGKTDHIVKLDAPLKEVVKKSNPMQRIVHICFFLLMFLGLFDGLVDSIFGTAAVSGLGVVISIVLMWSQGGRIDNKYLIIIGAGIAVTIIYYVVFVFNMHYDLLTTFKTSLIMIANAIRNVGLLSFFIDKKLDKKIVRIVWFFFTVEVAFFFLYLYFRQNGGRTEYLLIELKMLRDWQYRFQGTFAEPMNMGFYIGFMIFFIILYYESKWKYLLVTGMIYVLVTSCQAKFAVIAVPLALVIALLRGKHVLFANADKLIQIIAVVSFSAFVLVSCVKPYIIFRFVADYFGDNASFGDRFYFLVASLRQALLYPFGTGYGLNYEYYYHSTHSLLQILESAGLDSIEIRYAMIVGQQIGMNGKETLSHLICCYGLPGIYLLVKSFSKCYGMDLMHRKVVGGLLVFILIESLITIDILMGYCVPFILLTIMIINTCKKENVYD